jgi:hypothetical protein
MVMARLEESDTDVGEGNGDADEMGRVRLLLKRLGVAAFALNAWLGSMTPRVLALARGRLSSTINEA